jgi:hypothetical protein
VRHAAQSRTHAYLLAVVAAALALVALALLPGTAGAYDAYRHGGINDCETCHINAHTRWTPVSEVCLSCHSGYQLVRTGEVCWTCHAPGQDMDWARTDASCLSTCHLRGGAEFRHTAHAGASSGCTTCHSVTKSAAESAGSAHHTVPAPRLEAVTPPSAAPGASVTLTGAKFTWAAIVRFGGVNAAFAIVSDGVITATVPAAAVSGPVTVLSAGGVATSATGFVVVRPQPPLSPAVTLAASQRMLKLGRRVQLTGRLTPAGAAAQVRVVVQRRVDGAWRTAAGSLRAADAVGAYAWSYRPRVTGAFRARASAAGAISAWVTLRVR